MRAVVAMAAILAATPALAQQMCGPADEVPYALEQKYQEHPVFEGYSSGDTTVMIFLNKVTGSWTIFAIDRSAGKACAVGGGMKSRVIEALHPGEPT